MSSNSIVGPDSLQSRDPKSRCSESVHAGGRWLERYASGTVLVQEDSSLLLAQSPLLGPPHRKPTFTESGGIGPFTIVGDKFSILFPPFQVLEGS